MKPALLFALAALAAAALAEGFIIHRQEKRLRELEAAQARQATPEGAAELVKRAGIDPAAESSSPAAAAREARKAADAAVAERASELERRLETLEKNALAAAAGGTGSDPAAIDDLVSKKVDEKMEGANKKKKGGLFGDDNKRPLADISKDLALTELQEDQMAEAINASQKLCFGIITTPRNDGTNVLDDIVTAMQDPEHAEEKVKAAFMQIFTAKIPGSDETYLGRIMKEKQVLQEDFKKILTEDQMKKFTRLGQDPHEIQTGYDPYGEYLTERLGKK